MFKPMLATDADLSQLRYPLLASAKLDGIRFTVQGGTVLSRSLKPIPNRWLQERFGHLEHFDGEFIVGDPTSNSVYRDTVSNVMSHDKTDFPVKAFVFDHIAIPDQPYIERAQRLLREHLCGGCDVVSHRQQAIDSEQALLDFEADTLEQGYEGLILRDPSAPYKFGRSTVKQGYLLKMKRFVDAEATVIGFEERMHNGNEAKINELGYTQRSSHAAGKTGHGDLGALVVRYRGEHFPRGVEFTIGTGFTADERREIWDNHTHYAGRCVKFKFFPVGVKDKPRHPVFLGWRSPIDL